MNISLDKGAINEIEHRIAPNMGKAITLPVFGRDGVVVYVATMNTSTTDTQLREVAQRLMIADKPQPA